MDVLVMRPADDRPGQEHIGGRDLADWPSEAGRAPAGHELGGQRLPRAVPYIAAAVGLLLVIGLTVAGAEIYDTVAQHAGMSGLDQPAPDQAIALRNAPNTALFNGFTYLGGPTGMTIIAWLITAVMVWRWRWRWRSRTPLTLMLIAVVGVTDHDHRW